jgi:hypothetical protein
MRRGRRALSLRLILFGAALSGCGGGGKHGATTIQPGPTPTPGTTGTFDASTFDSGATFGN